MVYDRSDTISVFVYSRGVVGQPPQQSLTAAVGLFQSVVSVTLLMITNAVAKKFGERGIL
jgi:putative aldouronate transport system permease protein